MIILRLIGASLLLLAALLLSREYSSYLERRILEYRGFVALLSHAEEGIERALSYGEELWYGFQNDVLEKCGLLPLLREGKGLAEAFMECKDKISFSASLKDEISEALSTLGRGYRDSELRRLSVIKASLVAAMEGEEGTAEKNIKVARALLIGGALAVGILII